MCTHTRTHLQMLCLCPSPLQYARDFYLGQWLRDTQVELEKALKGGGEDGPMETLGLEEEELPVASLSAAALQQAQLKTEMLHALMDPKNHRMVRWVELLPSLSFCLDKEVYSTERTCMYTYDV